MDPLLVKGTGINCDWNHLLRMREAGQVSPIIPTWNTVISRVLADAGLSAGAPGFDYTSRRFQDLKSILKDLLLEETYLQMATAPNPPEAWAAQATRSFPPLWDEPCLQGGAGLFPAHSSHWLSLFTYGDGRFGNMEVSLAASGIARRLGVVLAYYLEQEGGSIDYGIVRLDVTLVREGPEFPVPDKSSRLDGETFDMRVDKGHCHDRKVGMTDEVNPHDYFTLRNIFRDRGQAAFRPLRPEQLFFGSRLDDSTIFWQGSQAQYRGVFEKAWDVFLTTPGSIARDAALDT